MIKSLELIKTTQINKNKEILTYKLQDSEFETVSTIIADRRHHFDVFIEDYLFVIQEYSKRKLSVINNLYALIKLHVKQFYDLNVTEFELLELIKQIARGKYYKPLLNKINKLRCL